MLKISGQTTAELLENFNQIKKKTEQIIEIPLDQIINLEPEQVSSVVSFFETKNLCLSFRSVKAGGNFSKEKQLQAKFLQEIIKQPVNFIEVELQLMSFLKLEEINQASNLICAFIDPFSTPGYRNLRKLQKQMRGFKPFIYKFETLTKTPQDIQNLIRLLVSRKKSEKLLIKGTGKFAEKLNQLSLELGGTDL